MMLVQLCSVLCEHCEDVISSIYLASHGLRVNVIPTIVSLMLHPCHCRLPNVLFHPRLTEVDNVVLEKVWLARAI